MREGDPAFEALREAIETFAAARAPELVAEAKIEAVARARSMLAEAIAEELLARSSDLLEESAAGPISQARRSPPAEPRAESPPKAPARAPAKRATAPDERAASATPAERSPRTDRVAAPLDSGTGCYVYGVIDADDAAAGDVPVAVGVDGVHPTRILSHGGLAAILSDVPLSEFGEEPLTENLNDIDWLERTARAHEAVLDEALGRSSVVPMRLCTIYRGEAQVREMLQREGGHLADALRRLRGKTEWGVKMIAEPGALERHGGGPGGGPAEVPESAGAAYMDAKRRQAERAEELEELADRWGFEAHDRIAEAAAEALLNPIQSPDVAGYEGEMLLNGVYLVEDAESDRFKELVARLAAEWAPRGVSVELTGPWPAYNFIKSSIEAAR